MKVVNKYVWNWLVNVFFKPRLLSYKLNIFLLECEKDENPQVHCRASINSKKLNYNISSTYNLFKSYKVDYELA
jgi:hypothetical protein